MPAFAEGASPKCVETSYQTCTAPPSRADFTPIPGQPGAHAIVLYPDLPSDQPGDPRLAADCANYATYLALTDNDAGIPFWWLSESAARCPQASADAQANG